MSQADNAAVDLIRRAVEKAGSQRALGKEIDAGETSISGWLRGHRPVPDDVLAIIAAYVGEDPIETLAKTSGGRWKRIAQGITAGVTPALIAIALLSPTDGHAKAINGSYQLLAPDHCILCKLRRLLSRLFPSFAI